MKRVIIFGATGSIGLQTLEVIRENPDEFEIVGLAVRENVKLLSRLAEEFKPKYLAIYSQKEDFPLLSYNPQIYTGKEGLETLASVPADLIVMAISGISAIYPTKVAIQLGRKVAMATKEVIVTAGKFIKNWLTNSKAEIIPVDSEHSAIFQLLQGRGDIERIILTASGGPFYNKDLNYIMNAGIEEVLKHPRWNMGKKTTIDSANLVNKALEIIEAHYLFDFPYNRIDVIIHPQSIVHGIIRFSDGSFMAHLSPTDMRFAIQYALFYPKRSSYVWQELDFSNLNLEFRSVDYDKFPIIRYVYDFVEKGDIYPVILAVSDEILVNAFLEGRIKFYRIVPLIIKIMESWNDKIQIDSLDDLFEAIELIKNKAQYLIEREDY
ncbi:MAG: 1-deoxy-D-xylulose-5-phosphate reductoisomerase [Dictyoglomus sp. NZ13-RE01]|nr:MAG: 1-deoxy-D-xylulose-5-phosphate reductoisomerase [Dictyoglomus sp. NZ13-RE01]